MTRTSFLAVLDMEAICYSRPLPDRLKKPFAGGDEKGARRDILASFKRCINLRKAGYVAGSVPAVCRCKSNLADLRRDGWEKGGGF